jgi:PAS domain S-box-containing protein
MNSALPQLNPAPSGTGIERDFQKAILRLVKGGPERQAIEAGQIDAIIDPASGNSILLPEARRALIERKVGFRSLIGLAFDWYWEQDEDYRFVSHRGAGDDADGIAEEGIIGKTLWDLSIDNMSEADWRTHRQQLEWRAIFRDLELRHVDGGGEVRYVSISGEPVFDDRNHFKGYRGITRDITERKQAEALVQQPHRFDRAVLDALGAPIAVLDHAGLVLSANHAWRDFATNHAGVGTHVALGANYLAVCDDACATEQVDGVAIAAGIRQVIGGERALFRYDYSCDSPTGRTWLALSVTRIAENGNASAVVLCEDITERKRGELLLGLEFAVARCLANATTAASALQSVIRVICETQGWDCGRYFCLDQSAGVLRFDESWGVAGAAVEEFLEKSRGMVFRPGAGLAGRVCQSGQPLWIVDGARDAAVSPTALAPETGEYDACVFPVTTDDKVIGVLAFSASRVREPDDRMLQAVRSIGSQLGGFLLRQQAVDALRRSEMRFRVLNDLTSDWYWEQDEKGNFSKVSGPVLEMLGIRVPPLAGKPAGEPAAGWDKPKRDELLALIAARQPFLDFALSRVNADGSEQQFRVSGEPMFNRSCAFIGYRGIGVETTAKT